MLERSCNQDILVLIISYYNIIAIEGENRGGRLLVNQKVCDFRLFIVEAELSDIGFIGAKYIWYNEQHGLERIWK